MNPLPNVTVSSVDQYINSTLQAVIAKTLNGQSMVNIFGILGTIRETHYNTVYGVKLFDDSSSLLVDIPLSIVSEKKLRGGESVIVTGAISARLNKQSGNIETRIKASDVVIKGGNQAEIRARDKATIQWLKQLGLTRQPFPLSPNPSITLISSKSSNAQVDNDFLLELGDAVQSHTILREPVNMLSSQEIAAAIRRSGGDIVVLIRGGGDDDQFAVFDDVEVVEALAKNSAYRIVGLGHTGNATILDLVADFSANTPTQAGGHIRDRIKRNGEIANDVSAENRFLSQQLRERDAHIRNIASAEPETRNTNYKFFRYATLAGVWLCAIAATAVLLAR